MDKHHIRILITRFFENDFPKESVLKFQQWFTRKEDSVIKNEVLNELWEQEAAEADKHTLRALEEMNRRIGQNKKTVYLSLSRRLLRIASILLLPVIGGLFTYWMMHSKSDSIVPSVPKTEIVEHIVPDGEMKQVLLPDGSEVWLNAGSMLLYPDDLPGPDRCLFLSGEATFRVEKDPEQPFIVKTQYMQVEALGTTFNVRSNVDAGTAAVTLEKGLVRVDVNGKVRVSEVISPNEQLVYNHRQGKISRLHYKDIFTLEHENGIESIYEIQHSISGTGWADDNEGSILSFYEHDADPEDTEKWHNGLSMHCPTWDLANSYEPGDPRKGATIIFEGDFFDGRIHKNVASSTGLQPKKRYIPYDQRSKIDQSDCPKNIIFARYADVLLYLAEAANEVGKPTGISGTSTCACQGKFNGSGCSTTKNRNQ